MNETSPLTSGTAVEVRSTLSSQWSDGFEVVELTDDGYRVRRVSDGTVLPGAIPADRVRALLPVAEGMTAVTAHGLLHALGVISAGLETLEVQGDSLDSEAKARIYAMVRRQISHVHETLRELTLGLPPDVLHVLDDLRDSASSH